MSTSAVMVPSSVIEATVAELRSAATTERVVLWLGEKQANVVVVREVFVPEQHARLDYFHIPRNGMEQLLQKLRARRWIVVAQVHTHPDEAFHSLADDRWAIVRHRGALSIVVPRFCQETTSETFTVDAVVFQVNATGRFVEVPTREAYEVTS